MPVGVFSSIRVSRKHTFNYCIKYDSSEHMLSISVEFEFVLPVSAGGSRGGKGTHFFKYSKVQRNRNGQSIATYSASPPAKFWLSLVPVYLRPTTAPAAVCPRSSSVVVTLHTARTRRRRQSPLQQCRQRKRRPSKKGGRESFIEMPEN